MQGAGADGEARSTRVLITVRDLLTKVGSVGAEGNRCSYVTQVISVGRGPSEQSQDRKESAIRSMSWVNKKEM